MDERQKTKIGRRNLLIGVATTGGCKGQISGARLEFFIPSRRGYLLPLGRNSDGQLTTTVMGSGLAWPSGASIRNRWPSGEGK